jgi:hypothetical protein
MTAAFPVRAPGMRFAAPARGNARGVTRCVASLDELTELVGEWDGEHPLYVRWARDIEADLRKECSRDDLSGVELPGLSVNGLALEPWWKDRGLRVWIARRLYDYRHLPYRRGEGTKPWVLTGVECGRGPDNEPLLRECRVVAEVLGSVIDEATKAVDELPGDWGTLDRD